MNYRSYIPSPPLAEFVDRFWHCSDAPSHRCVRILPSGTMELVINLSADEVRIYDSLQQKRSLMNKLIPSAMLLCLGISVAGYSEMKTEDRKASKETKQKEGKPISTVGIRYMIDDVPAAIKFCTTHLGFTLDLDASPAFASVTRDGSMTESRDRRCSPRDGRGRHSLPSTSLFKK